MRTAAFDYPLPPECIAQQPLTRRDAARLMVDLGAGAEPDHRRVADLAELLEPGDLLVVNDTRVMPARLKLHKVTGGAAEVLLVARPANGSRWWEALVRPGRRLRPGTRLVSSTGEEVIEIGEDLGSGRRRVRLLGDASHQADPGGDRGSSGVDDRLPTDPQVRDMELVQTWGEVPLPPYITGPLDDTERYQTVYARRPASAAAPTAGLHLTERVLDQCRAAGVRTVAVELEVGLATFRPIATEEVADHHMHREVYRIDPEVWEACRAARRVVAVGTTVVRALEAAAGSGRLEGATELFITPGYHFEMVDVLLTNFHLPRSSLLVLVEAFIGSRWRHLYDLAQAEGYRFLSFGDAMLVHRQEANPGVTGG